MKLLRMIVTILIVVVLLLLAWRFFPGLRHRAVETYKKHGGWTEAARKGDPAGYLEYAEKKLTGDLESLADSQTKLHEASGRIAAEQEKNQQLLASATELAGAFKAAYAQAEANQAWPVEVSGAKYDKPQLMEQVRLILMQRDSYEQIVGEMGKASVAIKKKGEQLVTQITATKATLSILPAKREIARVDKLTEGIEDLLGDVDDLLGENERALGESPIRTVEELIQTKQTPSGPSSDINAEVKAFLEADK